MPFIAVVKIHFHMWELQQHSKNVETYANLSVFIQWADRVYCEAEKNERENNLDYPSTLNQNVLTLIHYL